MLKYPVVCYSLLLALICLASVNIMLYRTVEENCGNIFQKRDVSSPATYHSSNVYNYQKRDSFPSSPYHSSSALKFLYVPEKTIVTKPNSTVMVKTLHNNTIPSIAAMNVTNQISPEMIANKKEIKTNSLVSEKNSVIASRIPESANKEHQGKMNFRENLKISSNINTSEERIDKNSSELLELRETKVHFAISAFSKTATSFLRLSLLNATDQIFWGNEKNEIHNLRHQESSHIESFFHLFQNNDNKFTKKGRPIINGFKSPDILYSNVYLTNMKKYLPSTNMIVSLRHPVLWFESYYNFNAVKSNFDLPDASNLIGECGFDCNHSNCIPLQVCKHVCTKAGNFHHYLSRLGFTPMDTEAELRSLDRSLILHNFTGIKLFLMEINQVQDSNRSRTQLFEHDLEEFLGLDSHTLNVEEARIQYGKVKIHTKYLEYEDIEERLKKKLYICDRKYTDLRHELVRIGSDAADWIKNYFLKAPQVIVSSKTYFLKLLDSWKYDPCLKEALV